MTFQERLKYYREKAGYKSAKEFAEKLGMGYTTYVAYENKDREPRYKTLCKIARILKTSPNELLGFDPDHPTELDRAIQLLKECGIRFANTSPKGCVSIYVKLDMNYVPQMEKILETSPVAFPYQKIIAIYHKIETNIKQLEKEELPKIANTVLSDTVIKSVLEFSMKHDNVILNIDGKPAGIKEFNELGSNPTVHFCLELVDKK